ncbi:hypothetical protein E3N88_18565 [Mikania micrantha]|uniref:Small nuclear ribonucleoprotein G n=1 Tax=Mikania micrantha TaxID=192012 RepID=A0A5N6NM71_9ASTR|nr:hypothetical protein E3N88_18565 [Mikania micrantha]
MTLSVKHPLQAVLCKGLTLQLLKLCQHALRVRAGNVFSCAIDIALKMGSLFLIKLNANRIVVGTLRGFDQFMNLVIDNTMEVNGEEKTDIGMVVIRGNSVVTVEALEPVSKAQ